MSIGFILWLLITIFLLGFWGWTSYILFMQKRTWKAFSLKHKLRYRSNKLLDSPDVNGNYDGYQISIFATDHGTENEQTRRMMTTIEISLQSKLSFPLAIASSGMVKLVEELGLTQEYRPEVSGWDNSYIARSQESAYLETYLTPMRTEALIKLMKIKRTWVILIFGGDSAILRIDTPDALENPKRLEAFIKRMIATAKLMEIETGEEKRILENKSISISNKNLVKETSSQILNTLSLEDDS